MPQLEDVHIAPQEMWLRTNQDELFFTESRHQAKYVLNGAGEIASGWTNSSLNCFCVTKERPKVEYSYCLSGSGIGECADEKVAQGWIPQGGIHVTRDGIVSQAFWRWAE